MNSSGLLAGKFVMFSDAHALWLPEGRLVVADVLGAVAVLFGDVALPHAVTKATRRVLLFTVQVDGVPAIHVSEALWTMSDIVLDAQAGAPDA